MSMLFKRIKDWATTITSFRTGDVIPVDGPNGTAKMSKDNLLARTAENALSLGQLTRYDFSFTGIGYPSDGIVSRNVSVVPGSFYTFSLDNPTWSVTSLVDAAFKLIIRYVKDDGTTLKAVGYYKNSVVPADITIKIPLDCRYVNIFFRGDTGAELNINATLSAIVSKKDDAEKCQLYVEAQGYFYVEESNVSAGKVWVKAIDGRWVSRLAGNDFNKTNSEFATYLGVSLETSSSGVSDCIPINDGECFVLSVGGALSIKSRNSIISSDVVLIAVINGRIVAYSPCVFGQLVISHYNTEIRELHNLLLPREEIFVGRGGNWGLIYCDPFLVSSGRIYSFKASDPSWAVTSLTNTSNKLIVQYQNSSGTWVDYKNFYKNDVVPSVINVEATDVMKKLRLAFRADVNVSVNFDIYSSGVISKKDDAEKCQLYVEAQGYFYLEESNVSAGKVWIKAINGRWVSRLAGNDFNKSNSEFATYLGVSLETSLNNEADCIPIADAQCLVLSKGNYFIKSRTSVESEDVVLIAVINGRIVAYDPDIIGQLKAGKVNYAPSNESSLRTKILNTINEGVDDKFIFATDLHVLYGTSWRTRLKNVIKSVGYFYDNFPFDFVSFGGDWLTDSDTQVQAVEQLGEMTASCNEAYKKFLPILGNHDTNYQGVVSSDDSSRGDLSQRTIDSTMFCYNSGKSYYKYRGNNTTFYVFDTGIDWTASTTSAYQKEQLKWFAEDVENETGNIAILLHIITNDSISSVGNNFALVSFAQDILDVCSSYNARSSITKYGETYSFISCSGLIRFVLGGHSHADAGRLISDIPVVITTNFYGNNFDLVFVDYSASELKLIRVGSGADRTFTLYHQ